MKKYGTLGSCYMLYCWLRTKLLFPQAKIIRQPFDLRGKNHIQIGPGFVTGKYCRIEAQPIGNEKVNNFLLRIGRNVQINDHCHITAANDVLIGDNVLIASKVYISDVSHGNYSGDGIASDPDLAPAERQLVASYVRIEKNVWLGDGVCVLPGVVIGKGSIIGANSVVTKSIPPNSIAVGAPAVVIKQYNFESLKWEKI